LLSTILDIAAKAGPQDYQVGDLWGLSRINDPRGFETLVKIYKNDRFPQKKKDAVYELGKRGKEDALPILLDYFFQRESDLSENEIKLLEKYPVSERNKSFPIMDVDDRNKVVTRFIKYLQNKNNYNDDIRIAIANTLAILYASNITPSRLKEEIKASANLAVCYGHDEYYDGPAGYLYLKDFVDFSTDTEPLG